MYDGITPAQWVVGLTISLVVFAGLAWLLWHYTVPHDKEGASHMSTPVPASSHESVPDPVHVPVRSTSTATELAESVPPVSRDVAPDTNAPEAGTTGWEMPRLSRHLTDDDMIAVLALQRSPAGKLRYSANQIHTLVGGPRAKVLERVRLLREGPAEFKPLSPEQQAARAALGLEGK